MEKTKKGKKRYLPTYEGCYVCGQSHPRGLRVRFFMGGFGLVCAHFAPDADQTGHKNIIHGGVISALMDELLGWPIALQTGRMSVTGELTVRFRMPITVGQEYLATAFPGVDRGKYWEGSGEIRDARNRVVVRADGQYRLLSAEQTGQVAGELTYRPDDAPVFRFSGRRPGLRQTADCGCPAVEIGTPS